MALSLVTPPALDPVSLAEAKAHLKVDGTDSDGLIAGYLLAARQYAENYTHRRFINSTWDATFDWDWPCYWNGAYWRHRIDLPIQPVSSVTSVSYVDDNGATQMLTVTTQYVAHVGADRIGYVDSAYNVTWPSVRRQTDAVTVRFVAGYGANPGDVPEPIRHAILLHAEILHDRDPQSRTSLEMARDALLDPYRVLRL